MEEETVEKFLSQRGFYEVRNVNSEFLKSVYFKGKNQNRKVMNFFGFVHATVKPRE